MRVKCLEDNVVHWATSAYKSASFGYLVCQPDKRVFTGWLVESWEETRLPVTCPECLAIKGRATPRRVRQRRKGSEGMSKIPVLNGEGKIPAKSSGMGHIKTNGWIHMTTGKFGRRVTAKESRQRSRNEIKNWNEKE